MIDKCPFLNESEHIVLSGMIRQFYQECEEVLRPKFENPICDGNAWIRHEQLTDKVAHLLNELKPENWVLLNLPNQLYELEDLAPEGISFPWRRFVQ